MKLRLFCGAMLAWLLAANLRADVIDDAIRNSAALTPAPLISRDAWLQDRPVTRVRLSPNGKQIAFTLIDRHKSTICVLDIESGATRPLFTTADVQRLEWSTDSQFLFIQQQDSVAAFDVKIGRRPGRIVAVEGNEDLHYYGVDEHSPHHVFVSIRADASSAYQLFRIDHRGNRSELYTSRVRVYDFLAPANGPLTFIRKTVGLTHRFYRIEDGAEREILQCHFTDACRFASYSVADNALFLTGRINQDLAGLFKLDKTGLSNLHTDPSGRFDISGVDIDRTNGEPRFVEYETETFETYSLNAAYAQHLVAIKSQLGSPYFKVEAGENALQWLVSDRNPRRRLPVYHLYDSVTKRLKSVLTQYAGATSSIGENLSAIRAPFWYTASDGMQLQGYVTLPRGAAVNNIPLIVLPHGGPWNRTRGYFGLEPQFLANRGYAVFEPNFRASVGMGRHYMTSANREFGRGRVHQDIIEGTRYLLSRGIGNEDKLAMVGHSFGGFSVLGALAFEPKMFKVGVAAAPPSALSKAINHYFDDDDYDTEGFRELDVTALLAVDVNDPEDLKRSMARSPHTHASAVQVPLYIWAGAKDERVDILDVRDYALKLESVGKDVTLLSAPDSGHGPDGELAMTAYLYFMESALHAHLGGLVESESTLILQRYLAKNTVLKK